MKSNVKSSTKDMFMTLCAVCITVLTKTKEIVKCEYQLIQGSLHSLIIRSPDFGIVGGGVSLIGRIAAVHVVYRECCECIYWFGQLTSHSPGVLEGLVQSVGETTGIDNCMVLHLYALEKVLNGLEPPIKAKRLSQYSDDKSLRVWLSYVREVSNAIESTLSLSSQHPLALKASLQWQKIRAIQIFSENVLLNHSNMVVYARQLYLALRSESDFLVCSTVVKVKRVLNIMQGNLKTKLKSKEEKKLLANVRKSCTNFFIEVVSTLCFGQSSAPEDKLIIMLLDIVFTEQMVVDEGEEGGKGKRGTRNLTPFKDESGDKQPIIRSFLLQLLLEHDTENVKNHLKSFFNRCQQALVRGTGVDQELSLLCTQCFENATYKDFCCLSLENKIKAILEKNLLTSATDTLAHSAGLTEHTISLEALESVAKMRCCLLVVAELLQLRVNQQGHSQFLYGRMVQQLLEETRLACTESKVNTIDTTGMFDTTGPIVYLLKLLVYQGGFSCVKKITKDQQWMIPKEFEQDREQNTLDPFVMYNPIYGVIREEMSAAAFGRDYKELEEHATALHPQECVPLLLSVYEVYTMSRASTNIAMQLLPETTEKINEIILNCKALSRDMKVVARKLVSNAQGGPLAALQVTANQPMFQQTLGALVVHAVAVLISRSSLDLLCPFVTLFKPLGVWR
ncbi:E3 ubiquitin-protein ligase rnf213-alpha [Geodia barretti]|nr:E3 ubiquitin-protein ligase rnf213-alpha [Geodia barretti]